MEGLLPAVASYLYPMIKKKSPSTVAAAKRLFLNCSIYVTAAAAIRRLTDAVLTSHIVDRILFGEY